MPALLINNNLYCDTPVTKPEEITYEILNAETYGWEVYCPSMTIVNGEAHISFRLQTSNTVSLLSTEWLPVLQLSAKPKGRTYGVASTSYPRSENLQIYIDTDGILYILPDVAMNETAIVADMMAIFDTESANQNIVISNENLNSIGIKSDSAVVDESISVENDVEKSYNLYTAEEECAINFSGMITWGNIASGYRQVETKIDDIIISGQTASAFNIGSIYTSFHGFFFLKKGESIKLNLRHNAGKEIDANIHCAYRLLKS